jgi:hypothetical protein
MFKYLYRAQFQSGGQVGDLKSGELDFCKVLGLVDPRATPISVATKLHPSHYGFLRAALCRDGPRLSDVGTNVLVLGRMKTFSSPASANKYAENQFETAGQQVRSTKFGSVSRLSFIPLSNSAATASGQIRDVLSARQSTGPRSGPDSRYH